MKGSSRKNGGYVLVCVMGLLCLVFGLLAMAQERLATAIQLEKQFQEREDSELRRLFVLGQVLQVLSCAESIPVSAECVWPHLTGDPGELSLILQQEEKQRWQFRLQSQEPWEVQSLPRCPALFPGLSWE